MGLKNAVAGDGLGGLMGLMGGLERSEWRKAGRDGGDAGEACREFGVNDGQTCRDSDGGVGWVMSGLRIKATRFTTFATCASRPWKYGKPLTGGTGELADSKYCYGVFWRLTPIWARCRASGVLWLEKKDSIGVAAAEPITACCWVSGWFGLGRGD